MASLQVERQSAVRWEAGGYGHRPQMQSSGRPASAEAWGSQRRPPKKGIAAAALPLCSFGWCVAGGASVWERVCAEAAVSSLSHGFLGKLLDLILQATRASEPFSGVTTVWRRLCAERPLQQVQHRWQGNSLPSARPKTNICCVLYLKLWFQLSRQAHVVEQVCTAAGPQRMVPGCSPDCLQYCRVRKAPGKLMLPLPPPTPTARAKGCAGP